MTGILSLLNNLFSPEVEEQPSMTLADKIVIERFAVGDQTLREEAIEVHRRNIPVVGVRGNPHQVYMAEIDTPCPDLAFRAMSRERLLAEASNRDARTAA